MLRKGILGLDVAAIGLLVFTFIVALVYIVLANFGSSQETAIAGNSLGCFGNTSVRSNAFNAICNMTGALNSNLTGNMSIIVIAIVFGALLVLFKRFRA